MSESLHPSTGGEPTDNAEKTGTRVEGESRAFTSPQGEDRLRAELLAFLEAELHRPILIAEPHPLWEEQRRRLASAREAITAEMELLKACGTGEELALVLLDRIATGALDGLEADIRFLGFRSIGDLGRELAERAQADGVSCEAPSARPQPDELQALSAREHQDRLLDEAIEETFPASDPVSVPRVD